MSVTARKLVQEEFDIEKRVLAYQDLFARWRELRRPRPRHLAVSYGSRLDKIWIPNWLVRMARRTRRNAEAGRVKGAWTRAMLGYRIRPEGRTGCR
jgi:hypothetical protein